MLHSSRRLDFRQDQMDRILGPSFHRNIQVTIRQIHRTNLTIHQARLVLATIHRQRRTHKQATLDNRLRLHHQVDTPSRFQLHHFLFHNLCQKHRTLA